MKKELIKILENHQNDNITDNMKDDIANAILECNTTYTYVFKINKETINTLAHTLKYDNTILVGYSIDSMIIVSLYTPELKSLKTIYVID